MYFATLYIMKKKKGQAEFVQWFGPVLDALRELGDSGKPKEVSSKIADKHKLSDDFLDEVVKSGGNRFHNQVAWARQYLVWEGLLDSSKHGTWKLTEKGRKTTLDTEESRQLFLKWVEIHRKAREAKAESKETPDLIIPQIQIDDEEITIELIDVLRSLSPSGFERVCKELLREHGFEKVEVTGQSNDGGIDGYGVLELNPFVSFKVLFQCKRYKGSVSRAQVGDFRNAMIGRAEKGIILTTGSFTRAAENEASRDGAPPIELVDGTKLVEMFEKIELGLRPKTIYEIDMSYFNKFMD